MKKTMFVLAIVSLSLAGCGNDASKYVGTWKEKTGGVSALAIRDNGGGDVTVVHAQQGGFFGGPIESRLKAKLLKNGGLEADESGLEVIDFKLDNGELVVNDKEHYTRFDASPDKINDLEQQWKAESQKKQDEQRNQFRNGFGTLPDPTKVQLVPHK